MYRDQLHQALLKDHACQEHTDALSTRELAQLHMVVAEEEDAMTRLEADSTHALSRQHEEHVHKQRALFHVFDSTIRDKGKTVFALHRELTNHREHNLLELEAAQLEAERLADMSRHVFSDGPSTQPYATPVEVKTTMVNTVTAVAHAVPVQTHPQGLSLGASAGNMSLRARNKGCSTMVIPVRRRLRPKTPPIAQSMGAVRRRMCSKARPPKPDGPQLLYIYIYIYKLRSTSARRRFYSTTPRRRRPTLRRRTPCGRELQGFIPAVVGY